MGARRRVGAFGGGGGSSGAREGSRVEVSLFCAVAFPDALTHMSLW